MQYKITRQYARDVEMPLAEFHEAREARFFMKAKLESDAEFHVTAIYRLYNGSTLLDEVNGSKIPISVGAARYFTEEVPGVFSDRYKVAIQDLMGAPQVSANFIELKDARLFIEKKLPVDIIEKKKITYRIMKNNQMLEKFEPVKPRAAEKNQATTQANAENKTSFRPTPFNTVPRPAGSPQGWIKERMEKEGEKE
ncbi:MAG: hypothetical protein K0S27_1131 [Gammaproteobacteria bacterium]|jgi:hypothetical protein|nr:hypothetical protein [Gammaproteobacteria bacterium]